MAAGIDPEAIEQAEFPTALRGYDKVEVDAYLRRVAVEHRKLLAAARSAPAPDKPYHRLGQDVGELLQHAKDVADRIKQRAEEEATRRREEAKKVVRETKDKAKREAQQTKEAAEYEAKEKLKDAQRRLTELQATETKARERLEELRERFRTVLEQLEQLALARGAAGAQVAVPSEEPADRSGEKPPDEAASPERGPKKDNVVIRIDAESEEASVST